MQELSMLPLIHRASTRISHSALPDSPVIVEQPPGRLRLLTADALHRLATRLDRGRQPLDQRGAPLYQRRSALDHGGSPLDQGRSTGVGYTLPA
ncbi:MAG TPA: hypothetical protein VGB74_08555 [Actinoplanes sp.]|jgi:hypothetical protein